MGHKGHWGEYTGNAKWSRDHAHTRVTSKNYDDAVRDDAAHIDYLKRDINYDAKHGHSDEKMTADEKHISRLAGDMKYDKEHHSSAAKHINKFMDENHQHNKNHDERPMHSHKNYEPKKKAAPQMSALHAHTDEHMRKQAERKAKKTQGDAQDIYYEMKSDKMEKEKKKEKRNAAPQSHCMGDK